MQKKIEDITKLISVNPSLTKIEEVNVEALLALTHCQIVVLEEMARNKNISDTALKTIKKTHSKILGE